LNLPACVAIRLSGSFNPANGQGSITAWYRNDSNAAILGRIMFVIVEDSVYFMDSLGGQCKEWHNHTARDYIPGPYGVMTTVAAGDSVSYTQPFTIPAAWRWSYCSIITFIQDSILRPDTSTKNIWQGAMIKVSQLVGLEEASAVTDRPGRCAVLPNPCVLRTSLNFDLPSGTGYRISICDVAGRRVREILGQVGSGAESLTWDCRDQDGDRVSPGVYPYRLESARGKYTGTVLVR
jgi:hypothetical protein